MLLKQHLRNFTSANARCLGRMGSATDTSCLFRVASPFDINRTVSPRNCCWLPSLNKKFLSSKHVRGARLMLRKATKLKAYVLFFVCFRCIPRPTKDDICPSMIVILLFFTCGLIRPLAHLTFNLTFLNYLSHPIQSVNIVNPNDRNR